MNTTVSGSSSRKTMRAGAALVVAGAVASLAVEPFHPSHEPPNNHAAVFAEYAASHDWIAVHLAQFAAFLLLLSGLLLLLQGLRRPTGPSPLVRLGEAATVITGAVMAVLQGVDGVALKHAVDSWAAAPEALKEIAFRDGETVRWIEWAMAGYFRIIFGAAVIALGFAVLRSVTLPRWTGAFAVVSGVAHVITGIAIGAAGFEGAVKENANLVSWAALMIFAIAVTVAAWRAPASRTPIGSAQPLTPNAVA